MAKDVVEVLLHTFGYENFFEKTIEDKNHHEKHKIMTQQTVSAKKQQITKRNQKIVSFLSIFGFLGLDRFYFDYYFTGIFKLYTLGGFYVLWIADAINIRKGKLLPKKCRRLSGEN